MADFIWKTNCMPVKMKYTVMGLDWNDYAKDCTVCSANMEHTLSFILLPFCSLANVAWAFPHTGLQLFLGPESLICSYFQLIMLKYHSEELFFS